MAGVMPREDLRADGRAAMLARLGDAGYGRVETPVLGPASVFLDFSGEEIRAGLFLTGDGTGQELCLRPEYTIPVCRTYLASATAGRQASFSYCGPVFRSRPGAASETLQAGLESFARPDVAAADAEVLALALGGAGDLGMGRASVRLGDANLLGRILDVLDISASWRRRIRRGLERGLTLDAVASNGTLRSADHSGVLAALTGADRTGARALVEDLLTIAGIDAVGGRSVSEIADRFMTQVADRSAGGFAGERREVLDRFLTVRGHPDDAARHLRALAVDVGLDLTEALDLFEERANFIAVHDLGQHDLTFEAAFGRLGYYTGFMFEARRAVDGGDVVVTGGRYDGLAQALGSAAPVAAVGASIWVDRLPGTAEREP